MTIEQVRQIHVKLGMSEQANTEILKLSTNSYSEEEVLKLLVKHQSDYRSHVRNKNEWSMNIIEWFNQNKK
jgi:hypothetical protein